MESILQSAWDGLRIVCSWPNILVPVAGTLLSMLVSLLPGVGGITLMALAIPFTLFWDQTQIMLLFGAFCGGATFMGSVSAILLNIPGRVSNAATTFDGYPMSQRGQARTAIGASAVASALGSSFGVLVLILLIPVVRRAILLFGPPEFLALVIWGLTTVAVVSRGSLVKGLAMAGIGLLLSLVGYDPSTAELRYTFGSDYLRDGLSLVPLFLGLFALTELITLLVSGRVTISGETKAEALTGSLWEGGVAVFRNFGLFLRSSVIGTVVGIIPGTGGTVAGFVAYAQAAQTARVDRDNFGKGDVRGVLAPEAANDAKDAGALVPTFAFGIPGGTGTAVLLTVMTMHGVIPGKELLTNHLDLAFVLIWSLFLSNWITSILGLASVGSFARLTVVRSDYLAPVILTLVTVGAYVYRGRLADVVFCYACGVLGYYLKKYGWSRVSLVIALMLGSLFENHLHLTLRLQELGRVDFWRRPIAVGLLGLALLSLVLPYVEVARNRRRAAR